MQLADTVATIDMRRVLSNGKEVSPVFSYWLKMFVLIYCQKPSFVQRNTSQANTHLNDYHLYTITKQHSLEIQSFISSKIPNTQLLMMDFLRCL